MSEMSPPPDRLHTSAGLACLETINGIWERKMYKRYITSRWTVANISSLRYLDMKLNPFFMRNAK